MNPITIGLVIALAFSSLAAVGFGNAYRQQLTKTASAESERDHAKAAADTCSAATARLQTLADARKREADAARRQAGENARASQSKAQVILSTPPTVPGDACKSASDRFDAFLSEKKP